MSGQIIDNLTGEVHDLAPEISAEAELDPDVAQWFLEQETSLAYLDDLSDWLQRASRKDRISRLVELKSLLERVSAGYRKVKNSLLSEMEEAKASKWLERCFTLERVKGSSTYGYNKELIPALKEAVREEQGEAGLEIFYKACVPDWKTNKVYLNKMEKFGGRTGAIIEAMVTLEKEGENTLTIIGPCGIKL